MKNLTIEAIRGQRIKALRVKTKLNRTEFCRRYNLPLPTVKSWEYGEVKTMHGSGINSFVNGLIKEGVPCTLDYILNGDSFSAAITHRSPISFIDEITRFHDLYNNAVDHIIVDDSMTPYLQKNCLILALPADLSKPDKYLNQVCIIKLKTGQMKARVVAATSKKNVLVLISANKNSEEIDLININDLSFIAPVIKIIQPF